MMKITQNAISVTIATLILSACGGGGGDSSSSGSPSPSAPISSSEFKDITVPSGFDWKGSSNQQITFSVVSNMTQVDGVNASIRGHHILKIYSMTSSSADPIPFFTGRTDSMGQIQSELRLSSNWQSIKVTTTVDGENCTSVTSISDLTNQINVGCDLVLGTD
ncbi:hypothetical protein Q8W40_00940 [Vibrio penaeicida]|uniref:hypothetical protein n=1 Tax=Vibrio penaeicida TaxID=104609 RepID=UPI00273736D0|nr:hypothetical protein [Vibrio penaeicida]MDP2570730.1 hypothetical protein [Vibrio penaeicida]